jgi:hypothetical protein
MITLTELFWHLVSVSSGIAIGLVWARYIRDRLNPDEETYDKECEFVTEYIARMEHGPKVMKRAFSEWPDWADEINPIKQQQSESVTDRNFIGKKD